MLKAKVGFLATTRRPPTDGRFARLIPSLLARCGYKMGLLGINSDSTDEQPCPNPLVISEKRPSKTNKWAALARKILQVKPSLVYLNSIDLQILAFPFQILFGSKLWIDILENDITNTLSNSRYSGVEQWVRLWLIQDLQKILPWNNLATVAEESFFSEIAFGRQFPILLEHETVPLPYPSNLAKAESSIPVVLVTGTLGRHYGTLDAIAWSQRVQLQFPHKLKIEGYSPDPLFAKELAETCETQNLSLRLYEAYRPQEDILKLMATTDFLLCPYHLSAATRNRIPTKFSEAAFLGITLIFPENPAWVRWCRARKVSFRLLETPEIWPNALSNGLHQGWVTQRLALQEAAILASLQAIE